MKKRAPGVLLASFMATVLAMLTLSPTPANAENPKGRPGEECFKGNVCIILNDNGYEGIGSTDIIGLDPSDGKPLLCTEIVRESADPSKMYSTDENVESVVNTPTEWYLKPEQRSYVFDHYTATENGDATTYALGMLVHMHYENEKETYFGMTAQQRVDKIAEQLRGPYPRGSARAAEQVKKLNEIVADARANTILELTLGELQKTRGRKAKMAPISINYGSSDAPHITLNISGPAVFTSNNSTTLSAGNGDAPEIKFTGPGEVTISTSATVYGKIVMKRYVADGLTSEGEKYQSAVKPYPQKQTKNPSVSITAPRYVVLGVEKSLTYTVGTDTKQLVNDEDSNNVSDLSGTLFGLFHNGQQVQWNDEDLVLNDEDEQSTLAYDADGETPAKYADAQGNPVDSKPATGPVQGYANKDGKLYFAKFIADKGVDYEVRELKAPKYTSDSLKTTVFEVSKLKPTRKSKMDDDVYERFNGEESHTDFNAESDLAMINEFDKFSFDLKKYYTLNGHKFTDPSQAKINTEKNPYSKVILQLEKHDGTPLTWNDNQMYFIKKNPSKYVKKGSFASTTGNVQLKLNDTGEVEVEGILSLDEESYQLKEIQTSERSHVNSGPFKLNAKSHTSITSDPYLDNALDYTNVKLVKKGNYLSSEYNAHKALASFEGAEYGLFYGDGPHKDQPVMTNDCVVEASKALDASQPENEKNTKWMQDGQVRWVGEKNKPLEIRLHNIVWGSYYIQELKAGVGHHIDTHRYYFGDKPSGMPENGVFVEPKKEVLKAGVEKLSSEMVSVDDVKLFANMLQKREALIHTGSPFMTSEKPAWGGSKKPVYSFGKVDYTKSETSLGATSLANNIYQLYYAKNFDDSESTLANTPVKWDDPAVEHLKITHGTRASGFDGVAIATDENGFVGVKDVAYGSYYWKEVQTSPGLTIDPKEYFWGVDYSSSDGKGKLGNYAGTTDKNAPHDAEETITQTQNDVSKADHSVNWEWKNTFADGREAGSTNHVLTFGFSSKKLAKNNHVEDNGENGVKLTLTPINGTKGEPITTTTFTQFIQDNSGKTKATRGYFEFRTVPYGQYLLTSDGSNSDHASEIVKLLEINPIIVDMHSTGDTYANRGYEITFHLDNNKDGVIDEADPVLSKFSSDNDTSVPNQSQINTLKTEDTPSSEAEEFGWMRDNYVDVNPNGLENNNFISLEANLDSANFEVNDLPKAHNVKIRTTATNETGGKTLPGNVKTAKLNDKVEIVRVDPKLPVSLDKGQPYTLQTRVVRTDDVTKQLSPKVCKTFTWDNQKTIDVNDIPVDTMGLHGKDVVVFERLYKGKVENCDKPDDSKLITRHENPNDKDQTLKVKHDGKLKTTATNFVDNSKHVSADKNQSIRDSIDITHSNLMACKVYSISAHPVLPGRMEGEPVEFSKLPEKIDKLTPTIDQNKQPAIAVPYKSVKVIRGTSVAEDTCSKDGKDLVLKPNEFVYHEGMEKVDVLVEGIDLTDYKPRTKVVMFEKIEGDDITPLIHADINDRDQTTTVEPSLKTRLFNVIEKGKLTKVYTPGSGLEFIDKVQARGITAKRVYTATLDLMTPTDDETLDEKDGIKDGMTPYLDASGKPVTKTVDLNVEKNNVDYSIALKFTSNDKEQVIVAYETLVDKEKPGEKIEHKNPKDKEQTVTPKKPEKPTTPPTPELPDTGSSAMLLWPISILCLVFGAGLLFIARRKI